MIQIPLSLAQGPCWELENRKIDSTMFLQIIAPSFPEATTAFFEGSCIAPEVVQIFEQYVDFGPYLPKAQTLWSTGRIRQFRCRFTAELCQALVRASLHHAEPELFDHLFRAAYAIIGMARCVFKLYVDCCFGLCNADRCFRRQATHAV